MSRKIGRLLVRLLFIPLPGLFLLQLLFVFVNALDNWAYRGGDGDGRRPFPPLSYEQSSKIVFFLFFGWLVSLLYLELYAAFGARFPYRRTLENLRFAPLMSFFFAMIFVFAFDLGMIEYSKHRIRQYVFDASERVAEPDFRPHNDYRGWCGNGYSERQSRLYFAVAAEGIDDPRPAVRARSYLMTRQVRDFFNAGDRPQSGAMLDRICRDPDARQRLPADSIDCRDNF